MNITQAAYKKEIARITKEVNAIKRIDSLNSNLHEFNWLFLHPYNQGFEVDYFENLLNSPDKNNAEQRIFERFARQFLDLKRTITMIDGFYRNRPFLCDFIRQIEESVILCIQKDFSGAINLLIPVIEGSIRNYLITKRGDKAKTITKISDLSSAFGFMEKDYVELQKEYLHKRFDYLRRTNTYFDSNQEKQILYKNQEYFSLWIKQLKNYLENKFYLDTRKFENGADEFNRHNLVHGLGKIDYSFRNYLRLLNCLNFLNWAFGVITKGCSILAELDEDKARDKWIEYFKILIVSEAITESKSKILNSEIESFKIYIDKTLIKPLSLSEMCHKQLLKVHNLLY